MSARPRIYVLLVCAFAPLVFVLWTQTISLRRQNAALAEKLAALTKGSEALKPEAPPIQHPAKVSLELLRLRNEVSMLRQKTNALSSASSSVTQASDDSGQGLPVPIPSESWMYVGYGTPEASIQTAAWAMRTGNLEEYLACFTPEDRAKAAERFQGKSSAEVQRMLIVEIASARALRLDKGMMLDDGTVAFPISSREVDDGLTVTKEEKVLRFKNVGGEWKFAN